MSSGTCVILSGLAVRYPRRSVQHKYPDYHLWGKKDITRKPQEGGRQLKELLKSPERETAQRASKKKLAARKIVSVHDVDCLASRDPGWSALEKETRGGKEGAE